MQRLDSQVSLSCAECDTRKNLKYRCMECKVTICEKCKDIHSFFPSNSSHTVLSFDDIASYNCTENEINKMPCKKHVTKKYSFFCQTCKFLICEDCFAEGHSYHRIIEIDQFLQENFRTEDKSGKPTFRRMSSDDSDILLKDCPDDDGSLSPVWHSACAGSVFMRRTVEFKVIKTFKTHLPAINCIEMVNTDEAFICHYEGDICKIKLTPTLITNRLRHIEQVRGLTPADIAVNSVGDIYFICKIDKCIKLVKKNKHNNIQVSSLPKHFTMEPLCIHCEKDNNPIIWVGLAEFGANFKLSYHSSRQVVSILSNGNLRNIFEYTEENQQLFTFPWRITSNQGRIYVIDRSSESTGTVVALNKYGNMKWRYSDLHPSLSQKPFLPSDVVVTKSTNIIVLDSANNAFHILNIDGNLILQQSLEGFEIKYPFSMKFDESSNLWIGSGSNGATDNNAKLYKFQITGI
ncbi:uncharacterized protein LOC127720967 [Mytilus californianus]|uniref:uncharacterized protein LOC127720967 n=1 Tax=Mytilus californianus TaxID=6549 RepID=UPI0022476A4E|nr:uncharacterized protein LOC127720967 [Mytilus californianus]